MQESTIEVETIEKNQVDDGKSSDDSGEVASDAPALDVNDDDTTSRGETEAGDEDGDEPKLRSEETPDEQQMPIGDVLTELEESGFDPKSIEMLRESSKAQDESALSEKEMGQLRQLHELSLKANGILEGLDEEAKAKIKILTENLDSDKPEGLRENIAKEINNAFGEEAVDELANKILAARNMAVDGFMKWLSESIQNSDLTILMDAIIMGADFNSRSSAQNSYEAEGANQISIDSFFKQFADYPEKSLEKMLNIENELSKDLNWKSDVLRKAKDRPKEEQRVALKNYFLEMYGVITKSSGAENIKWGRASSLMAKEIFGNNAVIDPTVLEELGSASKNDRVANKRFDI